jgi:hypothetical protein
LDGKAKQSPDDSTDRVTQDQGFSSRYADALDENLTSELSIDPDAHIDDEDGADSLINEMDLLIDEKLSEPSMADWAPVQAAGAESQETEFTLGRKPPRNALSRWLLTPVLVLLSIILLLILVWQLWMRQSLPWLDQWLDQTQLVQRAAPYVEPLKNELEERLDVEFPERRDLPNLRLVSARVEPHPVRPSTTLLKVSLVNRSSIAQSFPWLELVLYDVDGRLVSRRTLSPVDYLHNNRVSNLIRANELRPVTIELLAFPRQAHGYELKIIER